MRALLLASGLVFALGCARSARPGPAQCAERGYPRTRGLYAVVPLDTPVPVALLGDPLVDGLVLQISWRRVQPTGQWPPDWSLVDEDLAAARLHGKRVALRVEAGVHTPDWVYAAGAKPYPFLWEEDTGPGLCAKVKAPLPWDPVYLGAWYALLWNAGERYNQNTALTHVQVTGLGALPGHNALPLSRRVTLSNWRVSCKTGDHVTDLREAGYNRARLMGAWEDILRAFRRAFPDHQLGLTVGRRGFPAVEEAVGDPVEPEILQRIVAPGPARVVVLLEDGGAGEIPSGSTMGRRLSAALSAAGTKGAQFIEVPAAALGRGGPRPELSRMREEVKRHERASGSLDRASPP